MTKELKPLTPEFFREAITSGSIILPRNGVDRPVHRGLLYGVIIVVALAWAIAMAWAYGLYVR